MSLEDGDRGGGGIVELEVYVEDASPVHDKKNVFWKKPQPA
ncbi:MAG: hypothetical protein WCK47_13705 [bacterium]